MSVRALQPIDRYNGYDCAKDPHHTFTPLELAQLARIDRRISLLPPSAFDGYEPECSKPRQRVSPEERLARKRETEAIWRAQHRNEKREKDREYRAMHRAQIKAYRDKHQDIVNAQRREKRKITKEEVSCLTSRR